MRRYFEKLLEESGMDETNISDEFMELIEGNVTPICKVGDIIATYDIASKTNEIVLSDIDYILVVSGFCKVWLHEYCSITSKIVVYLLK